MQPLGLEQTWSPHRLSAHDRSSRVNDTHWHITLARGLYDVLSWCNLVVLWAQLNVLSHHKSQKYGTHWGASMSSNIMMEDVSVTPSDPKSSMGSNSIGCLPVLIKVYFFRHYSRWQTRVLEINTYSTLHARYETNKHGFRTSMARKPCLLFYSSQPPFADRGQLSQDSKSV